MNNVYSKQHGQTVLATALPWSGSCIPQHFQETGPSSAQVTSPGACSRRCGNFSHLQPRHSGSTVRERHRLFKLILEDSLSPTNSTVLWYLVTDSGLLQKVLFNTGTLNRSSFSKADVNVFSKPTGVIITDGLGIAKG